MKKSVKLKKSDRLRKKTRKLIVKNLIVILALATVAFVGAYSWFTNHTEATADGINLTTQVNDGLEYYIMPPSSSDQYTAINSRLSANATWNENNTSSPQKRVAWHRGEYTFNYDEEEFNFMSSLFLCDITSNGKTFQIPKLLQYNNTAYVDNAVGSTFDTATANNEYMSFDIYFRSEHQNDVKLIYDSKIVPQTAVTAPSGADYYSNVADNADNYKGAAIGAVRLSVIKGGDRALLWIPGASVYYDGLNDRLYAGFGSNAFANKGAVYYDGSALALRTGEGTDTHAYYADKDTRNVIRATDSGLEGKLVASSSNGQLGSSHQDDITVVTLNQDGGDGYYYGHVRVNLWIEGEDAEARLAFVEGKFTMNLHFDIVS